MNVRLKAVTSHSLSGATWSSSSCLSACSHPVIFQTAIWGDAYLYTSEDIDPSYGYSYSLGTSVTVLPRALMLAGNTSISPRRYSIPSSPYSSPSILPADTGGVPLRNSSDPAILVGLYTTTAKNYLQYYFLRINFSSPYNTSDLGRQNLYFVPPYTSAEPVPQPNSPVRLDPVTNRLMNRLAYREVRRSCLTHLPSHLPLYLARYSTNPSMHLLDNLIFVDYQYSPTYLNLFCDPVHMRARRFSDQ